MEKPKSYIQNSKPNHSRLEIRKATGTDYFTVAIKKPDEKKYCVNLSQLEINRLARYLDCYRSDKSNQFIPTDMQVDAWIREKGLKYAQVSNKSN